MKNGEKELFKKAITEGLSNRIDKIYQQIKDSEISFPEKDSLPMDTREQKAKIYNNKFSNRQK